MRAKRALAAGQNRNRQTYHLNQSAIMQTLYCSISGIPLLSITPLSGGVWPLVTKFEHAIVHPIYDLPPETIIAKLANLLNEADRQQYQLSENAEQQLQLAVSATLRILNCLVTTQGKPAGLPGPGIILGSGQALLKLAKWHSKLIKKPALPRYRPPEAWLNFPAWTEACMEIYDTWHRVKRKEEDSIQAIIDADVDVRKVYKNIDRNKVWNWIAKQCADVPAGRLVTMKSLFTTPIINPLDWMADDVDDLTEIISKNCDATHDIMHYVMSHCNAIRKQINDYNSGFVLITSDTSPSEIISENSVAENAAMNVTLKSYRTQAEELTAAPVPPNKADYPKLVEFLKAQAEYRILLKLWKANHAV